jgi:N-acetylmuramoyl-L-alanine amidase
MKKIVIDPGHGGVDSGAVSDDLPGVYEKTFALDISKRLKCLLELTGKFEIRLTRIADAFVSLDDRAKMANDWGADFFVSIHHNARFVEQPGIEIETWYLTGLPPYSFSVRTADLIQKGLIFGLKKQGELVIDRGIKQANFAVLRRTKMPAILTELGFITDKEEGEWLSESLNRGVLAELLMTSIDEAFVV